MKEIDELEGQELDAALARDVMGWTVQRRGTGNLMAILSDDSRVCIEHVNGVRPATLWNPSEDIAAAFQVIDYLRSQLSESQWQYFAELLCDDWTILSEDAPREICRAALKASGKGE